MVLRFPSWECLVPSVGTYHSRSGNIQDDFQKIMGEMRYFSEKDISMRRQILKGVNLFCHPISQMSQ